MTRIRTTAIRAAVATGLVAAAVAPTAALAAPAAPAKQITRDYSVAVQPGVLAKGNTIQAKAVVTDPDSRVADWWSKPTVAKVVRKGVNGKYEMPYTSNGYRCTPVVKGNTASFTCKLRGGDVSTTIKLTFDARYKG